MRLKPGSIAAGLFACLTLGACVDAAAPKGPTTVVLALDGADDDPLAGYDVVLPPAGERRARFRRFGSRDYAVAGDDLDWVRGRGSRTVDP